MADQRSQEVMNFSQVSREPVPAASLPQNVQRGFGPTATFSLPVRVHELLENAFRAARGTVILARCQVVTLQSRIKAQLLYFTFETCQLALVAGLGLEAANDPGFLLHDSKPNSNHDVHVDLPSGLLQPYLGKRYVLRIIFLYIG
jgi:hypothetical protein